MILVVGFPYIRHNYFAVFRSWPGKGQLFFLLPRKWKAKNGKIVFYPLKESNIITAKAFFYHSNYPLIGGLLKGWMPAFPFVLWRLRKRIDLVYSASEPHLLTTLYFSFFAKLFRKKHIVFSWENIPYWEKFHGLNWLVKKLIIKANLALSDGIICGNAKGKEIFRKLTRKPLAVIPMSGVDVEMFRRKSREKKFDGYDWSGKVVFTFAGAVGYRKGVHLIIEAFKRVAAEIPNAHLVIVGSGEDNNYEKDIDARILNSGVADKITRIPWLAHDRLPPLLEASDIFLYPSISHGGWEEQFGYSMAEASLMELPVIATRSGSIGDIVKDGETGILVEPDNPGALKEAMMRLGFDAEFRQRMGRAGREYIENNFSHQLVAQKFFEFFNQYKKCYGIS